MYDAIISILSYRGYYPKGGGEVMVTCHPTKQLSAVTLTDRGDIKQIYGISFVAGVLPVRVNNVAFGFIFTCLHMDVYKKLVDLLTLIIIFMKNM